MTDPRQATKKLQKIQNQEKINNSSIPRSAYLHIPFCRRRCYYCDFPISVIGNKATGDTSDSIHDYVQLLCQEIASTSSLGYPLETIFFGGGTPSLLAVSQLEQILQTLDRCFGIAPGAEISLEMNPETLDKKQLQGYKLAGINRISLGIQAFQDELLNICGRSHSSKDILTAWDKIRQVGFSHLSLDLISGLPHQTLDQWRDSLQAAIALQPDHLSCYDLIVEPVTAFGKQYEPGDKPLPTDENTAEMYREAHHLLTSAGYSHYEISNYAIPGYECRHNRVYWENRPYYGFGMGAASYTENRRFTRPRTRREYYTWVKESCPVNDPILTERDRLLETLMLGLRLAEGVSLVKIAEDYGEKIANQIVQDLQPYQGLGWLEVTEDSRLRLTIPDGFLFSNTVLATLFSRF